MSNQILNHANLFDLLVGLVFFASVFSACQRGLAKEAMHTFLFALTALGGFFFFINKTVPTDSVGVVNLFLNLGYYVVTMYALTWALLNFGAPLILDGHAHLGFRSRFWGGMLALVKLVMTLLLLNLWYAVKSPDAHPQRVEILPVMLKQSLVVNVSDMVTERLYKRLAEDGYLDYAKYTQRPESSLEQDQKKLEDLLGVE